ncbi:MAG: peptidoglycan DD-metalloendopeptidase family protein [Candidatus Omnitrophota bacterium]|nr:peptidoglycan DD-metalloendopeptidase family protein [Candidatus Omnitrophota bacterium]
MKKILFLFLIIICASCASQRSSYIPNNYSALSSSAGGSRYYVKKGDSLWAISKRYRVSVAQLMRENRISSPKQLKEGQVLYIPSSDIAYTDRHSKLNSSGSFSWPIQGEIVNSFGERMDNIINRGLNIKVDGSMTVNASASGKVVFCDYLKGWGQTLVLKHSRDFYTIYANLAKDSVREGGYVKGGDALGEVSSDANGDCVLHFEIRKQHLPQNPLEYLK